MILNVFREFSSLPIQQCIDANEIALISIPACGEIVNVKVVAVGDMHDLHHLDEWDIYQSLPG